MFLRTLGVALALALIPARGSAAEKRPVPDYDGRPREPQNPALWAPRIALFPLWLISEYVVRAPVRAVVSVFDRNAADGGSARDRWDLRPILVFDYGFRPRLGAMVTGNTAKTLWRIRADTFGAPSYALGGAAATEIGRSTVEVMSEISRRPDTIFHGFGPESTPDARVRVPVDRGQTAIKLAAELHPSFLVSTAIAVRGANFRVPVERDYVAFAQRVGLVLDLRPVREVGISVPPQLQRGSGVRIDVDGELATAALPARRWLSFGGTIMGMLDLYRGRILEVAATARFVDPLKSPDPPYLEQVSLGGDRLLRGHLAGRLHGKSALVAGVTYRWPVWIFLDGFISLEAGNVFNENLRDVSPKLFRLSATTGVRNTGASGYILELLAGFGTEPIVEGARISSARLLLAATRTL